MVYLWIYNRSDVLRCNYNDNNINTVIMKKGQMYFYLGRIFIAKKISGNDVLPTKSWGAAMSWHPIRHCKIIEGIINFKL